MMQDANLIIVFSLVVITLLIVDLLVVGKKSHAISTKEAGIWTFVFIAVSLLFAGYIYIDQGQVKATEFLSAYVIEKTLSVDNLFVFILVFGFFKVPKEYHHKVLFWGIIGAILLRAVFIFSGVELIKLTYVKLWGYELNIILMGFGAFLIYAGIKAGKEALDDDNDGDEKDFKDSPGAKVIRKIFKGRVTPDYMGDKFVVKQQIITGDRLNGSKIFTIKNFATPLLVVVGVVEFTDLLFAVDSIPAIFSVSKDPFILYSSNIFAILGLRSMYFLLANMLPLFKYLNHGLAIILAFIGFKMVVAPWFHIGGNTSLYIVLGILTTSIVISLFTYKKPVEEGA